MHFSQGNYGNIILLILQNKRHKLYRFVTSYFKNEYMISRLVGRLLEFIKGEKHWEDAKMVDHPIIKLEEEKPDLNKFEQV